MTWGAWLSSTQLQVGPGFPPAASFVLTESGVKKRDGLPQLHSTGRPKCQASLVILVKEVPVSRAWSWCPALGVHVILPCRLC